MFNQNNDNDEMNLMEYWYVIKGKVRYIALFMAIVLVVTIFVSFLMPKYYKSEVVIMPINKGGTGSLSALAGQFGGLASMAGLSGAMVGSTPSQQFLALLKTRTLAENIINQFNLMPVFYPNYNPEKSSAYAMEDGVRILIKNYIKFVDDKKNGTINISTEFRDPQLAADVANGYVEGLQKMIKNNSFTVSKRNRAFIEKQLEYNKRELLEAGKDLNEFYKTGKVSSVDSKIDVPLPINFGRDIIDYKGEIDSKLSDLEKQKADLESKLMVKDVPQQVYLQYLTLRRNLLAQINTFLTQQYEMAKIDEAKDDLAFQVIDPGKVPIRKSKPKRAQMLMMAFVSSFFIGVFASFFVEYLKKLKQQVKG